MDKNASMRKIIAHIARKGVSALNAVMIRESDVMLASFPKSGNTWMRFILSNIIAGLTGMMDPIDFFSIQYVIPDIHRVVLSARHRYVPFPRIVKTHYLRRPKYRQIIYLVRHPEKVMISYYDFLRTVGIISEMSLSGFIRSERYGLPAWIRHVSDYVDTADLVISYDRLQAFPEETMQDVAAYFSRAHGVSISTLCIRTALEKSSIDNMRRAEMTKGRPYQQGDYRFVRSGKDRRVFMKAEDRDYIATAINKNDSIKKLFSEAKQPVR